MRHSHARNAAYPMLYLLLLCKAAHAAPKELNPSFGDGGGAFGALALILFACLRRARLWRKRRQALARAANWQSESAPRTAGGYMKFLVPLLLFMTVPAIAQPAFDSARAEQDVMAVLDAFMTAFNAQDAPAEERTFHFPHYRLASGQMLVLDAPGPKTQAAMNATYQRFLESGWARSAWTRRKIVHLSAEKAHVDTQFRRYRKDGSVIGTFDSLYILTKENGRWGIKLRSSFAW